MHVIERVVDPSGETLYDFKQPAREGIDEDVAADTSYAMQQVVQQGTGQAALALGRPAAGKTGTATNDKDAVSSAWFVGYTPQLSTAVMYVRGDGDDQLDGWLPSYFGADYPADTWTAIMQRDMAGLPVEDFPPPANLDGNAPEQGHDPYTPPPPTTSTTEPSSTPTSETTSQTPGPPSSTFTPPGQSSPTATDSCGLPTCPTSTDTSTQGPPSTPPGQQAYREERYW